MNKKNLSIKISGLVSYLIIALSLVLFFKYYLLASYTEGVTENTKITKQLVSNSVNALIKLKVEYYTNKFNYIFSNEQLLNALENKNRQKFYNIIKAQYERLSKINTDLFGMHIILPDNFSFIRVHKPETSDELLPEGKKKLIDEVNQTHKMVSGFGVGKFGYYFRINFPVFSKSQKYLGVTEVTLDLKGFTKHIRDDLFFDNTLLIKNIQQKIFLNDLKKTKDNFVIYQSTSKVMTEVLSQLSTKETDRVNVANRHIELITLQLNQHSKILIYFDISSTLNKKMDFTRNLWLFLILLLLLLMILWIYVTLYLSKTINYKINLELKEINSNLEKKIQEEVAKNREKDQQILQQSRLAQMGEMISMIAHQWRQPLTAIASTSYAISLKAQFNKLDRDTAIELSNNISDYAQHLSSTIDDFRNFFRPNKEKQETTYDEIINSVLNIVQISIQNKNITITQQLNCHENLLSYANELKQVVLNLIKNAEDILLSKEIEKPEIIISTYKTEDKLILEIKDNGGGIPEDIMDKIFTPYFSTKIKKDGTGLGLYMSKTIIEEHCGGELSVSNCDEGAVFKIILGAEK